jgi:hypothetical protein
VEDPQHGGGGAAGGNILLEGGGVRHFKGRSGAIAVAKLPADFTSVARWSSGEHAQVRLVPPHLPVRPAGTCCRADRTLNDRR